MSACEVDQYVAGLALALRGPRRAKADLLAEAQHSLVDAAQAHRDAGLAAGDAARRAIREFGSFAEVVPGYQSELAVAQGRRTAMMIAVGLAVLHLCLPLLRQQALVREGGPAWYPMLTGAVDYLAVVGAGLALLVRLGYGWGSRFVPDGLALTRALGRIALAFLALHGLAGAVVSVGTLAHGSPPARLAPAVVSVLVLVGAFGYATLCAWRCVAVSRPAGVRQAAG